MKHENMNSDLTFITNEKNQTLLAIHKSLRTVISQFYYRPHLFFNEIGFHSYCFSVFYRNPVFTKVFLTKDGKRTNSVHPEYGSVKNKINGKGRAWYDLAILNPRFIQENDFARVANNHGTAVSHTADDLFAVLEFKFIKIPSPEYKRQLLKDYQSLTNAIEALNKYMIVFSAVPTTINYFKNMDWDDHTRLIFTTVHYDNKNKKLIEAVIKPDNFLKLPEQWLKV